MTPIVLPSRFKLVYQGGHHNVYCDGFNHVTTSGGFVNIANVLMFMRGGKCDCDKYKAL